MNPSSPQNKQRDRFINLLRDLFQLNQPDLDFGLYRIMHAKSAEIEKFLTEDLLVVIANTFGDSAQDSINLARASYERELATAKEYGAADPDNLPKVQQARTAYETARDSAGDDAEIYDHLYRFFERYYDQGDFLSRRYYARETHERAAPYSVPYDGSEVYLHWANKDQYYIKTSESFNNYSIDLSLARDGDAQTPLFGGATDATPRKLHFKLVEAEEGEHNNVKAAADKDRFFLLDATPIAWQSGAKTSDGNATSAAELVLRFQYCADPDKTGNTGTWRDKRNALSVELILAALQVQAAGNGTHAKDAAAYHQALARQVSKGAKKPGGKQETQPLLARYLHQYTAKNTMDYFIHKDLGGFLKRELDFYIKNEVMRLDDLGTANAPHVANFEKYLKKLHTLRSIAHKLIEFLAQIEDFQKKLWLKKKFVVSSDYCVTLDRVPATLYPEIVANERQWAQWKQLGVWEGNTPGTVDDLKTGQYRMVDTSLYSSEFVSALLKDVEEIDDSIDGILINSENYQAGRLISAKFRKKANLVYLDPPYNTDATPIIYKNGYKDSSWASLMADRIQLANSLVADDGAIAYAIDDTEASLLKELIKQNSPDREVFQCVVEHYPGSGTGRSNVTRTHEYCLFTIKEEADVLRGDAVGDGERIRGFRRAGTGDNNYRIGNPGRPESFFAVLVNKVTFEVMGAEPPPAIGASYPLEDSDEGYKRMYPIGEDGSERVWSLSYSGVGAAIERKAIISSDSFVIKRLYQDKERRLLLPSLWQGKQYNATTGGTNLLTDMFGDSGRFSYPKSLGTMERVVDAVAYAQEESLTVDLFGGSGTTAHAVINRNRQTGGSHKYALVEMGSHADSVIKDRIVKAVYSDKWNSGKPTAPETGISHCFKVLKLESYEDTLNNLQLADDSARRQATAAHPQLREDYYLHYLLTLETEGSPSLLNVATFADPTAYQLDVKLPGSDAHELRTVDLVETFNWLIGLRVTKLYAPQSFSANLEYEGDVDKELPAGSATRLLVKGKLKEVAHNADDGAPAWWFRSIEGRVPSAAGSLIEQSVLVLWRKLSGNLEQDNAVLEAYLREVLRLDLANSEDKRQFEVIYVNGSHTLPKLPYCDIRLLEQTFHERMWESQDV